LGGFYEPGLALPSPVSFFVCRLWVVFSVVRRPFFARFFFFIKSDSLAGESWGPQLGMFFVPWRLFVTLPGYYSCSFYSPLPGGELPIVLPELTPALVVVDIGAGSNLPLYALLRVQIERGYVRYWRKKSRPGARVATI